MTMIMGKASRGKTVADKLMKRLLEPEPSSKGDYALDRRHDYGDMGLVLAVQEGLRANMVKQAVEVFALPAEVAKSIIPPRTLQRRIEKEQLLTLDESDRFVRVLLVIRRAIETFGDRDVAMKWMKTPNRAMGDATPFSVINTDPGIAIVERILGRIEHGVFS